MVRPIFAKFGGFFPKPPCTILREYARNMRINGHFKSALPPTLRGVFFPMFLAVFWAEAAVGGGMLQLHHTEVVQFQDTPYYCTRVGAFVRQRTNWFEWLRPFVTQDGPQGNQDRILGHTGCHL